MMEQCKARGFLNGLLLGMAFSFTAGLVAYVLTAGGITSVTVPGAFGFEVLFEWSRRNLGLSVLPFSAILGLYIYNLWSLQQRLRENGPLNEIDQLEHLGDVWISLFFGVGVIWTAIGMRGALLYALGDAASAVEVGAYDVLQKLVEGGILTALTTTIVGGIGGYAMRALKSLLLGNRLSRYYDLHEQHYARRVESLLRDIRASIDCVGARGSAALVLREKQ